jgi:hypothetical protein
MGFGSFFKKISRGANHFFHKVDSGASHFFKKTLGDVAHKVGHGIVDAGGAVAGVGKKVGNFLEKNSAILGDVGAGLAMAVGQPELAGLAMSAGQMGQELGSQVNRGSKAIKNYSNVASNAVNNTQRRFSSVANQKLGIARDQIRGAGNRIGNKVQEVSGQLGKLNQLQTL